MTLYAASSVNAYVPPGAVCAGHTLDDDPADPDYPYLSIDCAVCEPFLASDPFWAQSPEERPLTAREVREREHLKAQAEAHRQEMDDARDRALIALAKRLDSSDGDGDGDEAPKPAAKKRTPAAKKDDGAAS